MAVTRPNAADVGRQPVRAAPAAPAWSRRVSGWLVIVVPAAAELVVGGYRIGAPSLWRDEAATVSGSQRPLGAILDLARHQDAVHGAYYLLIHVVMAAGGTSATALRLPSLTAMALTAGVLAALGRRVAAVSGLPAPGAVGLLAGLALAAVPLTTRYAQEARPYALTSLFAVLATYLLVRAVSAGSWPWWAGYGAALVLTGLFNLFAVLLVVAHGVSLLLARPVAKGVVRAWILACAAGGVVLIPLAVLSAGQSAQLNWVTRPDPSTVATLIRDFAGAALAVPLVAVLALTGCLAGTGLARGRGLTLGVVALPWLVVPPVILLAVSLADPLYVERYVVFCLPALSLLVGAGMVGLVRLTGRAAGQRGFSPGSVRVLAVLPSVVLAAAIVAALTGPQRAIRLPGSRADNLRAVAAVLSARERRGDGILYLPWDAAVVRFAYPAPFSRLRDLGLGQSPVASATLRGLPAEPALVARRLAAVRRVWTVQWTSAGPGRTGSLAAGRFLLVRRWRIESVLLSLYQRRRG